MNRCLLTLVRESFTTIFWEDAAQRVDVGLVELISILVQRGPRVPWGRE